MPRKEEDKDEKNRDPKERKAPSKGGDEAKRRKRANDSEKDGAEEVPQTILRSDEHARHIWIKAHDSAVGTYGEGGAAHRVAYAALKHVYEKKGDRWVKKAEKGPSDPQAARGPATEPKSTDEPKAPTARGKVAHSEEEARAKAKEAAKEDRKSRSKQLARGDQTQEELQWRFAAL